MSEALWGECGFAAWHGHPKVPQGWSCSPLWGCRDKLSGQLHSCPHPARTPAGSGSACMLWGGCRGWEPLSAVGTRAAPCGSSAAPRKYSLVGAGGRDAEPGRSVPRVWGQHFEVGCRRQGRAVYSQPGPPSSNLRASPREQSLPRHPGARLPAVCLGDASVIWGAGRGRSAPGVFAARSHSPAAPGTGA